MALLRMGLLILAGIATSVSGQDSLTVGVYYESYCPDCIQYHSEQLLPAWAHFHDKLTIDLVPFGKAKQWYVDGHWEFDCQHGAKECLGNKLHACTILQACGPSGTVGCPLDRLGHVLRYIHCVEQQHDQLAATQECATKEELDSKRVIKCANDKIGEKLLNLYGNQTYTLRDKFPDVRSVPAVTINGVHNSAAEADLNAEICRLRPDWCRSSEEAFVV